jgi:hypothetical protein
LIKRYQALRSGLLDLNTINQYIDSVKASVDDAQKRHFALWPISASNPAPEVESPSKSYAEEITRLKEWIRRRIVWLDANMPKLRPNIIPETAFGNNVAIHKHASANSEESSQGNTAGKGNDGDTSTRWCANDGNANRWWKVDLNSLYNLVGSEVMWEFDGQTYGYVIEVSPDDFHWSTVVDKRNNTSTAQTQRDIFTASSVRYVRITTTQLSAGCWASFWEFRVFVSPTTGVDQGEAIPKEFKLYQNYPNPFNPTTIISYELPVNSPVALKVHDVLGREIETLVNERQRAGNYSLTFDARNLSGGVYYYRLQTAKEMITRKMVLIK